MFTQNQWFCDEYGNHLFYTLEARFFLSILAIKERAGRSSGGSASMMPAGRLWTIGIEPGNFQLGGKHSYHWTILFSKCITLQSNREEKL